MAWLRSEEEVDAMIEEMIKKTKGRYITQAVAFNKNSPAQMELLKKALMSSFSFGGFMKELLTIYFNEMEKGKHADIEAKPNKISEVGIGSTKNHVEQHEE